ncbi:MAG: hypothetical protein RLZZ28_2392 [Bacteroidota bacterium]|jgi:rhodanese-related sulfurtransferase
MTPLTSVAGIFILLTVNSFALFAQSKSARDNSYQCTPCGYDCDKNNFSAPGECSDCHMPLVKKSTILFKTIAADDVCAYLQKHPTTILLDVRTKEEFEGKANPDFGSLRNAINIPVQSLPNQLNKLSAYKNREIIVYCSHSHRSPRASYILNQQGFTHVWNMAGGMSTIKEKSCVK